MFQRSLLKDSDVEPLAAGVLSVLETVGVLCQNEEILRALEAAGASVDYGSQRAKYPKQMQVEHVEQFRAEHAASDDDGHCAFAAPGMPGLGGQIAQFFYDDKQKERRRGNKDDFVALIKLGEALHGEAGVGHSLLLTDVPPLVEPLEAALLMAEYASHPSPAFAWNVRQVDYLIEMGELLGRQDWFSWGAICFAHPLRFDRDVADKFVRRVRSGAATGLTGMPVAGVTTPVTLEGFIVVSAAEHLATWIAARALNPTVPLGGSMWAGTPDPRTGEVSYSSFDAMLYGCAAVEFLRRWCGMEVTVGGGEYCSAKEPGLYAALEKAYKALTIAAFTGRHPSLGQGMLDDGKVLSPAQLLLERDLTVGVAQYGRAVNVTPEALALATIAEVDVGLTKSYFETAHTLEHFRECLWTPKLIDRSGWRGPAQEAAILEKASQGVEDLLAGYRKPAVDPGKLEKMRAVVERAKRELPLSPGH
jgi:trimethylamine--corrinoid protein Co-methyltransferase